MLEFNFKGLHPTFLEAVDRHEPSIAFALTDGIGKFVFLLFMTTDARGNLVWGELDLFILLARTQKMLKFKLLGNHKHAGDFKVRFYDMHEKAIRAELGIEGATEGPAFVLATLLSKLNDQIPASIPLESKIAVIQAERGPIKAHCADYLDKADRVYLLRVGPLPKGYRPQEETLRKLYMLDAAAGDVAALIKHLKAIQWTAFWTASESKGAKFAEIFAKCLGPGR